MKKCLVLIGLIVSVATKGHADAPLLAITLQHDNDLHSLHIASAIQWNRNDLNEEVKRERLEQKGVFYSKPEGNKIVREYKVETKNIRVEVVFPEREQGRRLNESTRVELRLFDEDRLFFVSNTFGQHSEAYTSRPTSGVKFRPQSLSLYSADGLRIEIAGVYGETLYSDGVGIDKGLTFDRAILDITDDDFMNDLATRVDQSPNQRIHAIADSARSE